MFILAKKLIVAVLLLATTPVYAESVVRTSKIQRETVSKTLSANNTTASVGLFRVTGSVYIHRLYGVVTTVLGSNNTAAHWRMEDGTNTPAISVATGTTLSSAPVGSVISRTGLVATALTLNDASQVRVLDAASAGNDGMSPFIITQKAATNSDIVFRYTTTNTPTSGVIQFFVEWEPLTAGSGVVGI